ncbi:hypothetical protein HPB48_011358 [Haemaphysalis longicornis]|uniref:Uncharacterized protein n=1 Tax=Haemaphysalis longicornis TaxID=44386 RepID=A0A9J6FNA4_HAELO|nr:hypothetical protein HPB48_011358 [Haemaphysalis longicornis]
MCRLLRREANYQADYIKDCLKLACFREAPPGGGDKRLRNALRSASFATNFLWQKIFAQIPRKPRAVPAHQEVHVLDTSEIPPQAQKALSLGPKFCVQPKLDRVELLSVVRTAAARVNAEDVDRCVSEGVDVLRSMPKTKRAVHTKEVVSSLRDADMKLLLSDKEGGFAVMSSETYAQKAREAIAADFRHVSDVDPLKVRKTALNRCEDMGLDRVAASVKKSQQARLTVFFSAKTHKPECPFRVIVSERGTWQHSVGLFLQRFLSMLPIHDPFRVRKAQDVSTLLEMEQPRAAIQQDGLHTRQQRQWQSQEVKNSPVQGTLSTSGSKRSYQQQRRTLCGLLCIPGETRGQFYFSSCQVDDEVPYDLLGCITTPQLCDWVAKKSGQTTEDLTTQSSLKLRMKLSEFQEYFMEPTMRASGNTNTTPSINVTTMNRMDLCLLLVLQEQQRQAERPQLLMENLIAFRCA